MPAPYIMESDKNPFPEIKILSLRHVGARIGAFLCHMITSAPQEEYEPQSLIDSQIDYIEDGQGKLW